MVLIYIFAQKFRKTIEYPKYQKTRQRKPKKRKHWQIRELNRLESPQEF